MHINFFNYFWLQFKSLKTINILVSTFVLEPYFRIDYQNETDYCYQNEPRASGFLWVQITFFFKIFIAL